MTFPVLLQLGSLTLHPHFVFETLAYFVGFRLYLALRKRHPLQMPPAKGLTFLAATIVGAALGSKILYWLENPLLTWQHILDPVYLMEGKSIVGGLLGGLIAVEWIKKRIDWPHSTGDVMVFPLLVGMAIGRVGCFLTGLPDRTYGTPTTWITGVDFGDGVLRHPTQLYEIGFLLLLGLILYRLQQRRALPTGFLFQLFLFHYLLFRLLIDFIKPVEHVYAGLNSIQVACVFAMIYYVYTMIRTWRQFAEQKERLHA